MKQKKMGFLMLLPVLLAQQAKEQVDVKITFDANGVPQSATGLKQLLDDQGKVVSDPSNADGTPDTLVVSQSAQTNYANAIAAANTALEQQIVSENYPNGDFQAAQAAQTTQA